MGPREKEVNDLMEMINTALDAVDKIDVPMATDDVKEKIRGASDTTMLMHIAKNLAAIADILEGKRSLASDD